MAAQRGKRGDPNYKHVSGQIKREMANRFKAICAETERDMSDVLEELIGDWINAQGRTAKSEGDIDAVSFLKSLASSKRPTNAEIVEMAHNCDIQEELLFSLCDRLVPEAKGEHNEA